MLELEWKSDHYDNKEFNQRCQSKWSYEGGARNGAVSCLI